VHLFLKLRTNLECWDETLLERHRIARARVACHARLPALDTEHTKAAEFNPVAFSKRVNDAEEESIYNRLRLELRKPSLTGDLIDDIGFRYVQPGLFEENTIQASFLRTLDCGRNIEFADGKHTKAPYSAQP